MNSKTVQLFLALGLAATVASCGGEKAPETPTGESPTGDTTTEQPTGETSPVAPEASPSISPEGGEGGEGGEG